MDQVLYLANALDLPCRDLDALDVLLSVHDPAQEHVPILCVDTDVAFRHARAAIELTFDLARERDVVERLAVTATGGVERPRAIPTACDSARRARAAARRSPRRTRDIARSRAVWRRRRPALGSRKYASSAPIVIPPAAAAAAIASGLTSMERPRLTLKRVGVGRALRPTRGAVSSMRTSHLNYQQATPSLAVVNRSLAASRPCRRAACVERTGPGHGTRRGRPTRARPAAPGGGLARTGRHRR